MPGNFKERTKTGQRTVLPMGLVRRGLLFLLMCIVFGLLAPMPTQASCGGSKVIASALAKATERRISAAWRIEPACDVIETGVLIGMVPENLQSDGSPIYGYREVFQREIPVSESGVYWVSAYARDETGAVIQSPSVQVVVAIPQAVQIGLGGSHSPPPSYSGTDEDFLFPAQRGSHFASLKALEIVSPQVSLFGRESSGFLETSSFSKRIGLTHRDDVVAEFSSPVEIGSRIANFDPAKLNTALETLDQRFTLAGFPRPGLQAVSCEVRFSPLFSTLCNELFQFFPLTSLQLEWVRSGHDITFKNTGGLTSHSEGSSDSSATFFIPEPPPNKRVQSARFTASFTALTRREAVPSELRLNGKSPESFHSLECVPRNAELFDCRGVATWNFTDEVRSEANPGGGELKIAPDPVPVVTIEFEDAIVSQSTSTGSVVITPLNFNYPWQHGGANGSLAITFEEDCPKNLHLVIMPETVRPQEVGGAPTLATIIAKVSTCPPENGIPPMSVEIELEVFPPPPFSDKDGGHKHDGFRPTGTFEFPPSEGGGQQTTTCTVDEFDINGEGSCMVSYHSSEVSGVETIVANATDFPETEKEIRVEVSNLVLLPESGIGAWRRTGETESHPENHYGTSQTITRIAAVATDYFESHNGESLGINDISLAKGGLFDLDGNWSSAAGHLEHRAGNQVDIDRCAQTIVKQQDLDKIVKDTYSGTRVKEKHKGDLGCDGPADTPRIHYRFS